MPYTSEEIKKQLDEAVKKIRETYGLPDPGISPYGRRPVPQEAVTVQPEQSGDAEPMEPALPAVPIEPVGLVEHAVPAETIEPAEHIVPAETIETAIPQDLATLQEPSEPKKPAAQQKPAEPKKPTTQQKPATQKRPAPSQTQKPNRSQKPAAPRPSAPAATSKTAPKKPANQAGSVASRQEEKLRTFDITPKGTVLERQPIRDFDEQDMDPGPEDFNVKFDFDKAYRDVPEDKPLRFRRERRTGLLGGVLYSVFVICISIILASLAWLAASDVLGFGTVDEQVSISVSSGFAMDDIVDALYDAGLIKYKFLFNLYAGYSNAEEKIASGTYVLNKNYDYRALVHGMTARARVLEETIVTIPEGYTLAEIFTRLEDYGVCLATDLWETATTYNFNYSFLDRSTLGERHRLEGFLFPDTYNFFRDSSPILVIDRFLSEFDRNFTEAYAERAVELGYSTREIIMIASMIEREAGSDDERSRISAVIHNRLNDSENFPFLQIDATILYALAGRPFSIDIDSPYNSYTNEGLPPSPIANPGMESIRAALYPDSTNEYYYALNRNNTHEFFQTLAQHEAFVESDDFGGR